MNLNHLGWNHFFEKKFKGYHEQGYLPGRIAVEHKHIYNVYTESGELQAEVSGKFHYQALKKADFPAVGDWVVLKTRPNEQKAIIHELLPRKSKFSRKVAGLRSDEQIVAANIETVFLLNSLNNDFNVRRIERYLTLIWESGAKPVIVLNKADLCHDLEDKLLEVEAIAFGIPVHVVSCKDGRGLEELNQYLKKGETIAFLGSSGVGKSTLINLILGNNKQKTGAVRNDQKGKHTTTHRELILVPGGALVIDTPGMREIQLRDSEQGSNKTFKDIESLASQCRFNDCLHETEPGCAVKEAIEKGVITKERLKSYRKLQREIAYQEFRQTQKADSMEKEKWRDISRYAKQLRKKL